MSGSGSQNWEVRRIAAVIWRQVGRGNNDANSAQEGSDQPRSLFVGFLALKLLSSAFCLEPLIDLA